MFTSILAFKCNTELQNSLFPTKPELYGTFIWWQSGAKNALFYNHPVLWYIWWPTDKVGAEIALFTSLTVLRYIWWPDLISGCRNCTFCISYSTMVHLVAQ